MDKFWYRYIYPKNLILFDNEKLVAPEISKGGNFSYDKKGEFYSTTKIYGYVLKEDISEKYLFWLGLLNSQLFWFFIQNTGYVLRGGYYTFKTNYILPFPVPKVISKPLTEKIIDLVNMILLEKENNIDYDSSQYENSINTLVYSLYELTQKEIDIIESMI